MNESNKIPLFPLQTVLLPEFPLPLHIFEEKYKLLVDHCISNESEFGIVYTKGNRIKKIGCTAKIIQVYNKYEDGKMDILTIGQNRFNILNISEDDLYLNAEVEYFDDDEENYETEELLSLSQKGIEILQGLGKLKINNEMIKYISQLNLKVISFVISSIGGYTNDEKQKFLEMTSTSERLRASVEILEEYYQKVNSDNLPSVN
jgi:Lon protease-like protein